MTTPIIMLVLLMVPFAAIKTWTWVRNQPFNKTAAAAYGIALLFMFTGVGHFLRTESMALMLPEIVPQKDLWIQTSGVLEIALSIALILPKYRKIAAKITAILLVLLFPLNIHAAVNEVPVGGHAWGPIYLWIRGPVQGIILFWVYWFLLKSPTLKKSNHA